MEQLLQDIRYGIRQLVQSPAFTLVSALALGLGIGSVTTQLSVTNALFFRGLPFPEADDIYHLERINIERDNFNPEVPVYEFVEWQRQQEAFEELSAFYSGTANLTIDDQVQRYDGCFISANAFQQLRVGALLGRTLQPGDDQPGSPDVVLLSHRIWSTDFGSDADIVGKTAILNGRSVTIVGVMGPEFGFPVNEDLWVPLFQQQDPASISWGDEVIALEVFGHIKEGIPVESARASMAVLARNLESQYPDTNKGFRDIKVRPFVEEYIGPETTSLASVMLLITFLILLIACANVANLLLARSVRRRKEVAIRSALGATRNRIVYQFLTESVLLAILGSVLGVVLAHFQIQDIIRNTVELDTPFWMDFRLDWKVLLAVSLITVLTGIFSGLFPALQASNNNEGEVLKDDTRTGTSMTMGRFSKALVVVQISLAAIILTLVLLFTSSVRNALAIAYNYDPDSVLTARMGLFEEIYPDEQSRANFIDTLLLRLNQNPDIISASTTNRYRFLNGPQTVYQLPDKDPSVKNSRRTVHFQQVTRDFFQTMQMPVHAGKGFESADFETDYPRFAIINRAFAEREWPGQDPIGKRFQPQLPGVNLDTDEVPLLEIIGITSGMNEAGAMNLASDDGAAFYVPQVKSQMPNFITLLVRPRGLPHAVLPIIREEIARLDRNLPIYSAGTPRELNDAQLVQFRFFGSVFANFGLMASFLAAIGIYGVITFSVNQRIAEFGIRQALGATRRAVFQLVYRHAFKQLGLGFLIAFALLTPLMFSTGLRDSMAIFFYGLDPDSLIPYLTAFSFVAVISLLSAAPPALRAARTEPAQALRYE